LSRRILDPLDRSLEILFGVIVVLTFTGTISVASGGEASTNTVLWAAIGCNLAWGIVDGAMYLIASFTERARGLATLTALRAASDRATAERLILDALPPIVARALSRSDTDMLRDRLTALPNVSALVSLNRTDLAAAGTVCALVFASTLPVAAPFFVFDSLPLALHLSNAIAIATLFAVGWSLGKHAGRSTWQSGLGMVLVGITLVVITMALGG
jgi:VIT1/CCC1 family predicted Fe2+/Mn2+ transporter